MSLKMNPEAQITNVQIRSTYEIHRHRVQDVGR